MSLILQFKDVKRDDIISLGERLFLFSELANNKIQTPNSFIITNEALHKFLVETELNNKITELVENSGYSKQDLIALSSKIQELILNAEFPLTLQNDIKTTYDNMVIHNDIFRSASIQTIDFIRAGRSSPYLVIRPFLKNNQPLEYLENIKGIDSLIDSIKKIFAMYFNSNTISSDNINDLNLVVQKMTNPDKSALVSLNQNEILINACFGTSEIMKNNEVLFDTYTLDKESFQLIDYKINKQEFMLFRDENLLRTVKRNLYMRGQEQKLNYTEIDKLIEILYKLREMATTEYEYEFVFENNRIYLINIEPKKEAKEFEEELPSFANAFEALDMNINNNSSELISGQSFYSGKATGNVKIIRSLDDVNKVNNNDIIVCRFVKPEFIGAIEKASAIISDSEISSEIQDLIKVPCIINTTNATQLLNDNDQITIDANSGTIMKAEKAEIKKQEAEIPFRLDIKIDENTDVEALLEKIRKIKEFLKD